MSWGFELTIELTDDEIGRLEHEVLKGTATLRNREGQIESNKHLDLRVGPLSDNLFVDLTSVPPHVNLAEAEGYAICVSPDGYEMLKRAGRTGDRMGGPVKVLVQHENYEDGHWL